jgi:molybdenum cofactor cytidylyltransferase
MSPDVVDRVAGIVLAAGTSTRMGHNKLFVELEGETLVHRTVRRVADAGLDPVIVVLGHESERVSGAITTLPCRLVFNPDYQSGVNSSLRVGIRAASEAEARAAVVVLADMPLVTTSMIETLVSTYRQHRSRLVISDYDGVNAPPMLYDRSLFDELAMSEGQGCGKHVVKRHRHEAESLSWPAQALTDLDVPEDYERVKALVQPR